MSLNKLLIVSGPTASGKTSLALELAHKYDGELISADSRQIYRGMDIGTGKDHPKDIKIHLIDIIDPNQSFSVAEYRQLVLAAIKDIQSRGKLPIVVGGTGQYIDAIIHPRETFVVKPNRFLRFLLDKLNLKQLQSLCRLLDPQGFVSLNNSEVHNPRRLVRRIEVKLSFKNHQRSTTYDLTSNFLHLSLTAPNDFLYARVDQRVDDRLKMGLVNEIKNLLTKYSWSHPGLNTLAYKEFKPYFCPRSTNYDLSSCISRWRFHEHAYVRRQKTWFKKIPGVHFIDITKPGYQAQVFDQVKSFLSGS